MTAPNPPLTLGITLGDVTGIGPEVTLKALAALPPEDSARYLILGDEAWLRRLNTRLGLNLPLHRYEGPESPGRFRVHNPLPDPLDPGLTRGAAPAALAGVAWLRDAAQRCLAGELAGVVTAPVNKEAIIRAGQQFIGQTEFLSGLAGTSRTVMMLLGEDDRGRWLRVALATTHVAIKALPDKLSGPKIELAIDLAGQACRDLGLARARVGVCGLNPHAGEGGEFGREEIDLIGPAVEAARRRNPEVAGPLAADTLFYHAYRGEFDAVVAMYHDQGLGPLKMVAFEQGINWTLGLPFIRTSPDHGTAYDIAGQGRASASSMLAALALARRLAQSH